MSFSCNTTNKSAVVWVVFSCVCFAVVVMALIKPFYDPDFYWHLKTGEWIWEHKSLPVFDPFTINPQPQQSDRSLFILSSYWLFQVLLHFFHTISGFSGLVFFRFILALLLVVAVCRDCDKKNLLVLTVASIGLFQLLSAQFPERPQFVSIIGVAFLLSTIIRYIQRINGSTVSLILTLSTTMLLWANMHGGFLLGQVLMVVILAAEGAKFLHPGLSPLPVKKFMILGGAILMALLVSLINPNPLISFNVMLDTAETSSFLYSSNLEYSSLWEYYKELHDYIPVIALLSYVATFVLFVRSGNRTNITWIILFLLLGYMGAKHIRYYPFFVIAATLFAMQETSRQSSKTVTSVIIACFMIVSVCSLGNAPDKLNRLKLYGWIPASYYPVTVCDIVKSKGLRGNIFTKMDWGGYVLWKLSPENKVFCDGRQLFLARYWEYLSSAGDTNLDFYWNSVVNKYNIQIAILPLYDYGFKPFQLTVHLSNDKNWQELARNNNGVVFIKK